ncbi:hypothetical protein B0H66DRAFT_528977 [Apodospora peruviana]|uniref:Uncharacterized protein n=1 Tax=Apodospora peruviana TaxID=516989 RepID=A0AAE0IH20_9PEZI|nr:hypothetical protein B0H66DRAFT_528977 [Apodospora peruviana]
MEVSSSDSFQEDWSLSSSASSFPSPISSASTHDTTASACHIRNFNKVVDALKSAANRASSTPGLSRYTSVRVMLLQWEFDDLGVKNEVQQLSEVFRLNFGFSVDSWQIPSAKPVLKLTQTISNWVEDFDGKNNLFVLYMPVTERLTKGGRSCGARAYRRRRPIRDTNHEQFAEIKWSACEDILHEAVSDTLFLLDCCYSAGSASRPLRGFSETIAASGFDSIAPPPGPHSFTHTLTTVLRRWASESTAFSIVKLHTEILVSLKEMPPRQIAGGRHGTFEWRRTPVHYIRSSDSCPPSIVLFPLPGASTIPGVVTLRHRETENRDQGAPLLPRVILSITLTDDLQRDDGDACHRWLASFPLPTTDVTVEAVYRGFSTVVLVSLSVAAWDLLPQIPGCNFVCFATSKNLVATFNHVQPLDPGVDIENTIVQSYAESMNIRRQLEDVLHETRALQMVLTANSSKTHLFHFLMEQMSRLTGVNRHHIFTSSSCHLRLTESPSDYTTASTSLPRQDEEVLYTPGDLLKMMDVNHLAVAHDAHTVLRKGLSMAPEDIDRAAPVITSPQVTDLINSQGSKTVVIEGHLDLTRFGRVTPLSYVCAVLSQALRDPARGPTTSTRWRSGGLRDGAMARSPAVVLEYFCGLHLHEDDYLRGPQGLIRCLTTQLILSLVAGGWVSDSGPLHLPHLASSHQERMLVEELTLDSVCRLFVELTRLVPHGIPIYCIVDSLSAYEYEEMWVKDYTTVLKTFQQATNRPSPRWESGHESFKLILTSPTTFRSLDSILVIAPEHWVSLREYDRKIGEWRAST